MAQIYADQDQNICENLRYLRLNELKDLNMAKSNTRLEPTWIGKVNRPRLEPRILVEDPEKSYHAPFRMGINRQDAKNAKGERNDAGTGQRD